MSEYNLPELRQVVLLTGDLESTLRKARQEFGIPEGFRDEPALAKIGMKHEVFGFDRTYIEVCEPLNAESSAARGIAKNGDSGFMVCVQIPDVEAALARAKEQGLEPIVNKDHHGSSLTQWHPRDFGTIAEFDQMRPADSWHFAPEIYEYRSSDVVADIVAVHLAVGDPAAVAQRWALVSGGTVEPDGTSVKIASSLLHFSTIEGVRGVHKVECKAADPARRGEEIRLSGVDFVLV